MLTILNGKRNTSKFDGKFIKNYDENSDKGYILEVDTKYPKRPHKLHNDLQFLPEKMKIKICHKFICNLYNKKRYCASIRILKKALNHGLIIKKVHSVTQFNQKLWLKPYINTSTRLRNKNYFERDSF